MELSVFLAKTFGLYLLIISIAILKDSAEFKHRVEGILNNPPLLLVTAIINLVLGLMLVISHNLWVGDWRIVITLLGWLVLLKGLIRIFSPILVNRIANKIFKKSILTWLAIFLLIIGLFLSLKGFAG